MKYYLLRMPSDPEVIGVKNGIAQVEFGDKENANNPSFKKALAFFNSLTYWQNGFTVPNFDIHLDATSLKNAKFTDFIKFRPSLISCHFLINAKVLKSFTEFNIQQYYLYTVSLYKNEKLVDEKYWMFCCPHLDYDIVNFSESIFYTGSDLLGKKKYQFKDQAEFINFNKTTLGSLTAEVLKMNEKFDKELDFFVGRIGGMHVSERLKKELEKSELTGIKMLENIGPKIIME